jgi:uncharacterized protein (TIGR02444 family)
MPDSLPHHPFWTYSLRLYGQPQVQDACLKLQDEHGLDVNLVLFCIWCGLDGPGQLTADELNTAIARGGRWQKEVVERIRYIRRTLKQDPLGAHKEFIDFFRPRVQALELDGEHVEQLTLAASVPLERGTRSRAAAESNLRTYLDRCAVCEGSQAAELVATVLNAALKLATMGK